jgi:hypothetical protein
MTPALAPDVRAIVAAKRAAQLVKETEEQDERAQAGARLVELAKEAQEIHRRFG